MAAATAALSLVLPLATFGSSAADGPRPGLPEAPPLTGAWTYVVQGGAADASKAKQWTRVPMQVSTVYNATVKLPLPPGDPRTSSYQATNFVYLMSEAASPTPYGRTAPFQVRTVAFGSVPVTATLRMAQRRSEDGLPIAMVVTATDDYYKPVPPDWPGNGSGRRYHDTHVAETVTVEVEKLSIDGEDLELDSGCRSSKAKLTLLGKGYIEGAPGTSPDGRPWETGHYAPGKGGLLTGEIDVPAFAGCRTSAGEDISRLLTSTVAGDDNAVVLHVTGPGNGCTATNLPQVGEYDATSLCPGKLPGEVLLPPTIP